MGACEEATPSHLGAPPQALDRGGKGMDTTAPIKGGILDTPSGQGINGSLPWNAMEMTCQYPKQTAKYMHIRGLKKKKGYSLE